jgi:hypothetical protein
MIRDEKQKMLACAASIKPTNTSPEWARGSTALAAGRPCIIAPPNQTKKEEPKAGTCGLSDRQSSTLNPHSIKQKYWTSNRDSRLPILRGFRVGGTMRITAAAAKEKTGAVGDDY